MSARNGRKVGDGTTSNGELRPLEHELRPLKKQAPKAADAEVLGRGCSSS